MPYKQKIILLSEILLNVVKLYLFIFIGFIVGKLLSSRKDKINSIITSLLINVMTPIVIFLTLTTSDYSIGFIFVFQIVSLEALGILFAIITTYFYLRKKKVDNKKIGAYLFINGFPNILIYGIPVVLGFFNSKLIIIPVLLASASLVTRGTLGMYMGEKLGGNVTLSLKQTLKKLITFPPLLGIVAGGVVLGFHLTMPVMVFTSIKNVIEPIYSGTGGIIIGIILTKMVRSDIKRYISDIKIVILWRFVIMFGFFMIFVFILRFQTDQTSIRTILLIAVIGPPAVINVAFTQYFNLDEKFAAISVATVTLLALILLPLLILFGTTFF